MIDPPSPKEDPAGISVDLDWSDAFDGFPLVDISLYSWLNTLSQRAATINLGIGDRAFQFMLPAYKTVPGEPEGKISFLAHVSTAHIVFQVALYDDSCLQFMRISEFNQLPPDVACAIMEFHFNRLLSAIELRCGSRMAIEKIVLNPEKIPECKCELPFSLLEVQTGYRGNGCFLMDGISLQWFAGVFSNHMPVTLFSQYLDLPVRVSVISARCRLTLAELKTLGIGDVLLLESTSERAQKKMVTLTIQGRPMWECIKQEENLVVVSSAEDKLKKNIQDLETHQQTNADLDSLEMDIEFELESIKMSLGDLKSVREGYIFDLEKEFKKYILVYANGRPIAKGQIVRLGNRIGVRVLELLMAKD